MTKYLIVFIFCFLSSHLFGQGSNITSIKIQSKSLKDSRKILVCLPFGYEFDKTKNYNVVYVFDAQSPEFFNLVKSTFDYLHLSSATRPYILVGIETNNRRFDLTPPKINSVSSDKNDKTGNAEQLMAFIQNEVKPLIESRYRTNGYNIGLGHSLGGTFITYAILKKPEIFNSIVAISPNYNYDEEYTLQLFDSVLNSTNSSFKKNIYIAYGKKDSLELEFKKGINKLQNASSKYPLSERIFKFDSLELLSHSNTPIEGIYKGIVSIDSKLNISKETLDSLLKISNIPFVNQVENYFLKLSEWTGYKLPEVEQLNTIGYYVISKNKIDDAIKVFEWAIKLFPNDPNIYDSMGEAQLLNNDKNKAKYFFKMALNKLEGIKGKYDKESYEDYKSTFQSHLKGIE